MIRPASARAGAAKTRTSGQETRTWWLCKRPWEKPRGALNAPMLLARKGARPRLTSKVSSTASRRRTGTEQPRSSSPITLWVSRAGSSALSVSSARRTATSLTPTKGPSESTVSRNSLCACLKKWVWNRSETPPSISSRSLNPIRPLSLWSEQGPPRYRALPS